MTTARRSEVLRVLTAAGGPMSIADLAAELGVHPNTVRFHLEKLVVAGRAAQVTTAHAGQGRPPLMFRAVRGMDPAGPRHYRLLAEILVDDLASGPAPGSRAVAAGRAWGSRLDPPEDVDTDPPVRRAIRRLASLLDDLGFAPEHRDTGSAIALRHCPFLELATTNPGVVCQVHLGIMQGAMSAWRAPVTVDRLEAFAEPDTCVAHLVPAGGSS